MVVDLSRPDRRDLFLAEAVDAEPVDPRPGIVIDCSRPDPRRQILEQQRAREKATTVDAEIVGDPYEPRFTTEPDRHHRRPAPLLAKGKRVGRR